MALPRGIDYAAAYKLIRPYVSFRKGKLDRKTKSKITRYYGLLFGGKDESGLLSRPNYHVTNVRSAGKRELLAKYSQIPKGYKELKGVLVPVAYEGQKPKLGFRTTKSGKPYLIVGEHNVERAFHDFDQYEEYELERAEDTDAVVRRILKDNTKDKSFRMVCGKHQSNNTFSRGQVIKEAERYFNTYRDVEEWFTGIVGYTFKNQKSYKAYKAALKKSKAEQKRRTAKLRKEARGQAKARHRR